jgi:hypothetical protein
MEHVNKYLDYLLEKLYIFKPNVELDVSNCIDDKSAFELNKFYDEKNNTKKVSDQFLQNITKHILNNYLCFEVIDYNLQNRLNESQQLQLYNLYKKYKENKNQIREYPIDCCNEVGGSVTTESQLNSTPFIDTSLDTSGPDIEYIESLDLVTTKGLANAYGKYLFTGTSRGSCHRYEYKFSFNGYIYSIYDYLDENDKWYPIDDIYWHVATNCKECSINDLFIKEIKSQCK